MTENKKEIYTHDEAAYIIELFEELLVANNIKLPSPEDDDRDPDELEFSDTAIFITDYLSRYIRRPSDLRRPQLLNMIGAVIQSKMVLLDKTGYIATIGNFKNDNGLLFSNLYHRFLSIY